MVRFAMELSEQQEVPVLMRLTTRLSHSRANIQQAPKQRENECRLATDRKRFVLLPSIARGNYDRLVAKQAEFGQISEDSKFNTLSEGADQSLGVIASGIAYNYLMENFPEGCPHPVLKISHYPLPKKQLSFLLANCGKILVLEEGAPFIEGMLHGPTGPAANIRGRMTGDLPRTGELNPSIVAQAFGLDVPGPPAASPLVQIRPPRLCQGCSHIASYKALIEVMAEVGEGRVFSDIGCYTLGALPPFEAIDSCVDMGASVSMAKGAADAGLGPTVAVIGDSTFTHSGMTPLLDAIWENSNITVFILDNATTGMTGGQDSIASGRLEDIAVGLGVPQEHVHVMNPIAKLHAENVKLLRAEIAEYSGLSVVVAKRECIQSLRRAKKRQ